jgi:hypothetical protein
VQPCDAPTVKQEHEHKKSLPNRNLLASGCTTAACVRPPRGGVHRDSLPTAHSVFETFFPFTHGLRPFDTRYSAARSTVRVGGGGRTHRRMVSSLRTKKALPQEPRFNQDLRGPARIAAVGIRIVRRGIHRGKLQTAHNAFAKTQRAVQYTHRLWHASPR